MRTISVRSLLLITLFSPVSLQADTITATASSAGVRTHRAVGENFWNFTTPKATDTISWFTGANNVDGVIFGFLLAGTDLKFILPLGPPPNPRVFPGFLTTQRNNPTSSWAQTTGGGGSGSRAGNLFGTIEFVRFRVNATGGLGVAVRPRWSALAQGRDPFHITAGDLMDISGPTMDLMALLSVDGSFSETGDTGDIGVRVRYEDNSVQSNLLNISLSSTEAVVSTDDGNPYRVELYQVATWEQLADGEFDFPSSQVSPEEIGALLSREAVPTGTMEPLNLAIVLKDFPVPTVMLDAVGTVARLRYDLNVDACGGACSVAQEN